MSYSLVGPPPPFRILGDRPTGVWRRPRQFGFVEGIGAIPLSDTELLQTSLNLPLAIRHRAGSCEVVAVIRSDFLARPAVRADGRWLPYYMPIALRCLPFRLAAGSRGAKPALEMATDLPATADAVAVPFHADDGTTHRDFSTAITLLGRLDAGREALTSAAAALLVADLLVELTSTDPDKPLPADIDLLVVDPARFRRLAPARIAALAADGFLALDLATACGFSARLWAPHLVPAPSTDRDTPAVADEPSLASLHSFGAFPIELRIDDSALISFETIVKCDKRRVDPG